ncbi:PAC2 family-domain-containing protein [Melampsora americana]|nr:PAC2 family-domain-containing protein [Melampsora americana]KAH9813871.1 PAC2 family-domain-containing protein [Melampsora americana]
MNSRKEEEKEEKPYFYPSKTSSSKKPIFKDSILIIPIVSLGNVPQLAVDLLIQSTSFNRIGNLDSSDHIPILGDSNLRPFEVYQATNPIHSITILQQRSPVLKSQKESHILRLSKWIESEDFQSVLLLISIDSATRTDNHLNHPTHLFQFTYGSSDPSSLRSHLLQSFSPLIDPTLNPQTVPVLSAGGLGNRLIKKLKNSNSLLIYVAEGDGRLDAKVLALHVLKLLPTPYQCKSDSKIPEPNQNQFIN